MDYCVVVVGCIIYLFIGLVLEEYMVKLSEEEWDKEFEFCMVELEC